MKRVCVTGGAGFIGRHLCHYLKERGYWVRAIDYQPPEYPVDADEENWTCDLRHFENAIEALQGIDEVYALAADMGGMGYIGFHDFDILQNNLRINLNTAAAARVHKPEGLFYSSSACCYPESLQLETAIGGLAESDAWRGKPDTAYGVEKLVSEDVYSHLPNTEVRIARFHNIYGTEGTWRGGREKAPAALCRKIAVASITGNPEVEIWGDGEQTRSFCHIGDCLEMIYRLMQSDYRSPLNIGTDRLVSINELVDIAADAAGIEVVKRHIDGPQGVRGRNADLSKMKRVLDYEPQVSLEDGIAELYGWIEGELAL